MAEVLPVTTSFLAISSIFRLDAFTRSLSKENDVCATGCYCHQKHARIQGFVKQTVPLYSPSDLKRYFRISRGTFEQFSTFSSLATWGDRPRMISRQNYPKRSHILPIPSKPCSACLFCYREQNERNSIQLIPKTE